MLLIDNREPEHIQALPAEDERLQASVEQLAKALDDMLCVADRQGFRALTGGKEVEKKSKPADGY